MELSSLKAEVKDLRESIETRKLVERAKGILMKRCSIGEDEAFKLLQSHSQKENKKMKEIAAMIIDASKLL
ncbi:MAG: ANTAR domain-containing protein [Deltaproteobacteria bacterium]|nr:ANTAR domain-containing protein [Deltaproteobacteria bacterium]